MELKLRPRIDIGEKSILSYIRATEMMLRVHGRVFLVSNDRYAFKTMKVAVETGRIVWYHVLDNGRKIIILLEARA